MEEFLSISNQSKGKLPSVPLLSLKDEILGKKYFLSIAYVSPSVSRKLNKTWRGKDKATNILSFELSKNSGELIICPSVVKKEIKNFEKNFTEFLGFLVIHGMLHLKGMAHGAIMEEEESKYDQKYFSGYRHRNSLDKSRSGRIRKGRKKS